LLAVRAARAELPGLDPTQAAFLSSWARQRRVLWSPFHPASVPRQHGGFSSCCPKASTSKCLLLVLLATRAGPAAHRCCQHVPSRASRDRRISLFDQLVPLLQFGPCSRCPVSVQCPPVSSASRAHQKLQRESLFSSAVRKRGLVVCCLVVMRSVAQPGSCPHGRDGRVLSACQRVRS